MSDASRHQPPALVTQVPGPRSRALSERLSALECPAFDARRKSRAVVSGEDFAPIVYARGVGSNVWDADGNRLVDLTCGFGALAFGHCPPWLEEKTRAQSEALGLALGDVYSAEIKIELCAALSAIFPEAGARVLLGLSGADALTAALKTCVLATGKAGVIAFEGGYHGLSHGPLAVCGLRASFREPFAAQTGAFARFAPYPSSEAELDDALGAVDALLSQGDVGAIVVEPILGRGGCQVPPAGFLPALRSLADKHEALLVADEVWTGLGRSGAILASVAAGVVPDLVCVGKALGGGQPISACIGRASVMEAWGKLGGTAIHTATHFGAPPACAAAVAVLSAVQSGDTLAAVTQRGEALSTALARCVGKGGLRAVRGKGLMIGLELEGGAARALAVSQQLLARGYIVLTGGVRGDVLTLTPAFDIDASLFEPFADALGASLAASLAGPMDRSVS